VLLESFAAVADGVRDESTTSCLVVPTVPPRDPTTRLLTSCSGQPGLADTTARRRPRSGAHHGPPSPQSWLCIVVELNVAVIAATWPRASGLSTSWQNRQQGGAIEPPRSMHPEVQSGRSCRRLS
jgi:hypothetical protein